MISFDEALALIAEAARPLGRERVHLDEARGRVLAEDVQARIDAPASDVSTMDGYAVREVDLAGRLRIIGESFPGRGFAGAIGRGECVRIFTGAPIPSGADRVVIQEIVTRDGNAASLTKQPGEARYIRRRATDFATGTVLLTSGRRLGARTLVSIAGADVDKVEVYRRPRVAILATGDELVAPGQAVGQAEAVPESISVGLSALTDDWGGVVLTRHRLRDDLDAMRGTATEMLELADLIVVTGGASVGERDFAKAMFDCLDLIFSKVAMKPGKPVWLGRAGSRLVIGLPGNPTSAMVTARLLLAPLLAGLSGGEAVDALRWRHTSLADALPPCEDRETFVRARAENDTARPLPNQDSGAQLPLAEADLLIRRRSGAPAVEAGAMVEVLDF